jgi:leishmanolysin-like peptidase
VLAYAEFCQKASNDRPTFGRINFCPRMLPASVADEGYADLLLTALHEITHVLVFNSGLFPYFRDDAGNARTARDSLGNPSGAFKLEGFFVASGSTISYANERGMDCSWGAATSWASANIPFGLNPGKLPSDCVARLSTPRVKAAARAYFGCDTLVGAELENQDTSFGIVGSHWEARTLAGEYMASTSFPGQKISPITLAVFEDSGWCVSHNALAPLQ